MSSWMIVATEGRALVYTGKDPSGFELLEDDRYYPAQLSRKEAEARLEEIKRDYPESNPKIKLNKGAWK